MRPNILFVMADQLRADYLGCSGHPTIRTPVLDALAAEGVRFERAYVQSPVCGASRMSFYTGRYVISHGASYNNVPLRVDERTLGDALRPLGYRVALVGKTHMRADVEGMQRLGVDPASDIGVLIRECGFEPFVRDDGIHPAQALDPDLGYNRWLNQIGYGGENPWHDWANAADGEDGTLLSGWYLRNAGLPARIPDAHSETAYMTDRAIDFVDAAGDGPWCLHLSYIKPHWPYIAPAPWHAMYSAADILPANRAVTEREGEHPVVGAYRAHEESASFSREEVRDLVVPTYMGLISQLDAHLGRLFDHLRETGQWERTLVVFTSDHGDYLGDHWLGEKDLFHEESARVPLIVKLPGADVTSGTVSEDLVEAIDLVPTFREIAGGEPLDHLHEGRSLLPLLGGSVPHDWREAAFSEIDYAWRHARTTLGVAPDRARAFMVRTADWKYVFYEGFRPELFDLRDDPRELRDLGASPAHEPVRRAMHDRLYAWLRTRRSRVTISNARVAELTGSARQRGYIFGAW